VSARTFPCSVCGMPCSTVDEETLSALGMDEDGSLVDDCGRWHVQHIACAKRERAERQKAEATK
jgi:hypothetical protein